MPSEDGGVKQDTTALESGVLVMVYRLKNFLGGVILTLNFGTSALVSTTKY